MKWKPKAVDSMPTVDEKVNRLIIEIATLKEEIRLSEVRIRLDIRTLISKITNDENKLLSGEPNIYPVDDEGDCYICGGSGWMGTSRYWDRDGYEIQEPEFCGCKDEGVVFKHYTEVFEGSEEE